MLDLNSGTPWETVTLTTLSRDRVLFPSLLSEARQLAQAAHVGRTVIYTAWGADWKPFGRPRMRRLLESVVLDKGVKERIVEDVKGFMKRGQWYFDRGESSRSFGGSARVADSFRHQAFRIGEDTSFTALQDPVNRPLSKLSPDRLNTTSAS